MMIDPLACRGMQVLENGMQVLGDGMGMNGYEWVRWVCGFWKKCWCWCW